MTAVSSGPPALAPAVTVREIVTPSQAVTAAALLRSVWQREDSPVPHDLMVTLQHTGAYVFGAYDESDTMVGVAMGLLTDHGLHSHITGIAPSGQRRGLGLRLKMHQRDWALARGISTITWTCDPLVLRNVTFNLHALGATVVAYLPDFYGPMTDGLNQGDESDRFELHWDLTGGRARQATAGRLPFLEPTGLIVPLPQDIESLRQQDPAAARAARHRVRAAVTAAFARGLQIQGLTFDGALVLS